MRQIPFSVNEMVFLPVEPQPSLEADDGDVVLQRLELEPRVDVEGASLQNLFLKKLKRQKKGQKICESECPMPALDPP